LKRNALRLSTFYGKLFTMSTEQSKQEKRQNIEILKKGSD